MKGMTGTIIGIVILAMGLVGLGFAISEMMTEAAPAAALRTLAGLGVFAAACFVTLFAVAR